MSSPYIQVELDALKKAPLLASVLGIQMREAIGGMALMWAHVYTEKTDLVAGFYLRAFFGVDEGKCAEALRELGFIDPVDGDEWRVRGAGRYTRITEIRRAAGRKGGQASAQAKAGFAQASAQANGHKHGAKPSPRADSSSPTGKKNYRKNERSVDAPSSPASPDGAGEGAASPVSRKPVKPPRPPPPAEGTPEYREAVALGDYETLQWGPWAPKAGL